MYKRKNTRVVNVGSVAVGGDSRISVQTMTKTDTRDVDATVAQIHEVQTIGCDIVRLAVVDEVAAVALAENEFEKHRVIQDRILESDFDREVKKLLTSKKRKLFSSSIQRTA